MNKLQSVKLQSFNGVKCFFFYYLNQRAAIDSRNNFFLNIILYYHLTPMFVKVFTVV